jgi:hypothetical protein
MSAPHCKPEAVAKAAAAPEAHEEIEITPAMIAAGAAELMGYVHHDVGPSLREELAIAIYTIMRSMYIKEKISNAPLCDRTHEIYDDWRGGGVA